MAMAFVAMSGATAFAWQGGPGIAEPSVPKWDTSDVMWPDANVEAKDKIYFNGFVVRSQFPLYILTPMNPYHTDAQFDGGSMHYELHQYAALLGAWRDCNGDGYIGNRVAPVTYGNWHTYPIEVADLVEADGAPICPVGSDYNDGTWVSEFRAIGPGAQYDPEEDDFNCDPAGRTDPEGNVSSHMENVVWPCADQYGWYSADPNGIDDEEAHVWADYGVPGSDWTPSRTVWPPRGTFDDSDSTIEHVEFTTRHTRTVYGADGALEENGLGAIPLSEAWDATYGEKPNVGDCGEKDPEFMGGPDNTCGLYPLQQARRLYNDSQEPGESGDPIVWAFDEESDCRYNEIALFDDQEFDLGPAGEYEVRGTYYYKDVQPGASGNPLMEGSVGGTYENVYGGVDNVNGTHDGECGTQGNWDHLEVDGSVEQGKTRTDNWFRFYPDRRYHGLEEAGYEDTPLNPAGIGMTGYWRSFNVWLDRGGGRAVSQMMKTFYASVGEATLNAVDTGVNALPAQSSGAYEYGAEACTGKEGFDPVSGWNCSPQAWHDRIEEEGISDGAERRVVVGTLYDLRDTDCYDGSSGLESYGLPRPSIAEAC